MYVTVGEGLGQIGLEFSKLTRAFANIRKILLIQIFHPCPWESDGFKPLREYTDSQKFPEVARNEVRAEMKRIRDQLRKQDKSWVRQLVVEQQLWDDLRDATMGLDKRKLKQFFVTMMPLGRPSGEVVLYDIGVTFIHKVLPREFSARLNKSSEVAHAHLTNLGHFLRMQADHLLRTDAAFREQVEKYRNIIQRREIEAKKIREIKKKRRAPRRPTR